MSELDLFKPIFNKMTHSLIISLMFPPNIDKQLQDAIQVAFDSKIQRLMQLDFKDETFKIQWEKSQGNSGNSLITTFNLLKVFFLHHHCMQRLM